MRPANEACETCHYPNKFSNDSVAEVRNYLQDEKNTYQSTFLMMKIGGGTKRQGLGRGIHWHIENKVTFLATDPLQQSIPYVRVQDENGEIKEYYDISSDITPGTVAETSLAPMDCITCHNRVTHIVPSPEDAVGQAITKGLISADLPFVNQQAVKLLSAPYPDMNSADAAFEGLKSYYSANYAENLLRTAGENQPGGCPAQGDQPADPVPRAGPGLDFSPGQPGTQRFTRLLPLP